jgi:hypothetical protein
LAGQTESRCSFSWQHPFNVGAVCRSRSDTGCARCGSRDAVAPNRSPHPEVLAAPCRGTAVGSVDEFLVRDQRPNPAALALAETHYTSTAQPASLPASGRLEWRDRDTPPPPQVMKRNCKWARRSHPDCLVAARHRSRRVRTPNSPSAPLYIQDRSGSHSLPRTFRRSPGQSISSPPGNARC